MAKIAVLIGVSEYEPGLNPLPASVQDVEAIAKVLQHPEMGGFDAADITKLVNPDPQKMQEVIETLFSDRRKDDLILLYFSGHGIKDETGKLYLATRLTRKNSQGRLVKATAVPANFIHNIMSESRSKRQVVILDCCFSGAFAEGLSAKDDGSVDIYTQLGGEGRVVLTSSTSTQYSFQQEGDNLSIYTRYIVEGIETGAADQDNDGVISIDELHEYAKRKVKEAAPAMQPEIYAVKEGFKIRLAKAPIGDPKLKYRQEVERFASRGVISVIGRNTLNLKRQSLGLLPEEATIIETEVLKPYQEYQERLRRYEQVLVEEIKNQSHLSREIQQELKVFQEALGLKDQDVELILARVVQPKTSPKEQVKSSLINEAIAPSNSQTPTPNITTPPQNYSLPENANKIKQSPNVVVVSFATILALTGMMYGIYALMPYLSTKFSQDTPQPSPTSSSPSTQSTPETTPIKQLPPDTQPTPKNTPNKVLPTQPSQDIPQPETINNAAEAARKKQQQEQARIRAEADAAFKKHQQEQARIQAEADAAFKKQQQEQVRIRAEAALEQQRQAEAALARQRQFDEAQSSCVQEKDRYKRLIQEGAANEQGAIDALNRKNCSDYGITWP